MDITDMTNSDIYQNQILQIYKDKNNNQISLHCLQKGVVDSKSLTIAIDGEMDDSIPVDIIFPENVIILDDIESLKYNENACYIDYISNRIFCTEDLGGQDYLVSYYSTGLPRVSANKIFTNVDNNGNILTVLEDMVRKFSLYEDVVSKIENADVLINTLEVAEENVSNQINILEQDTITANTVDDDLKKTISKGKTQNDILSGTIAEGNSLDSSLKNNINTGTTLNNNLTTINETAKETYNTLKDYVPTATQAKEDLGNTITSANTSNETLTNTITSANTIDTTLKEDITNGNTTDTNLKNDINDAKTINDTLSETIINANTINTTLSETTSNANSSNTTLLETIDKSKAQITTMNTELTSAEERANTAIDNIKDVASQYSDASSLSQNVNTIEESTPVNLLKGTINFSSDYWISSRASLSGITYNGLSIYTTSSNWGSFRQSYEFKKDNTYTLGVYIKSSVDDVQVKLINTNDSISDSNVGGNSTPITDSVSKEWTFYTITFTALYDIEGLIRVEPTNIEEKSGILQVCGYTLVKGSYIPDKWIPNLYDSFEREEDIININNNKFKNNLINMLYPVGVGILPTFSNVNPSSYLGGTWVQVGQGQVIVGVGTGTDKNNVYKTFNEGYNEGEYEHTITEDENNFYKSENEAPEQGTMTGGSFSGRVGVTHSNDSFSLMPPSFAMYFWKRIS